MDTEFIDNYCAQFLQINGQNRTIFQAKKPQHVWLRRHIYHNLKPKLRPRFASPRSDLPKPHRKLPDFKNPLAAPRPRKNQMVGPQNPDLAPQGRRILQKTRKNRRLLGAERDALLLQLRIRGLQFLNRIHSGRPIPNSIHLHPTPRHPLNILLRMG